MQNSESTYDVVLDGACTNNLYNCGDSFGFGPLGVVVHNDDGKLETS